MSQLFDLIIDQILSGVRGDGLRINFKGPSISEMRKNFYKAVSTISDIEEAEDPDLFEEEIMTDYISSIPIMECIHGDDLYYFQKFILSYYKENK